ncbi:MAG: DNA topoisomerase IV subunit A [Alphaproteobacteria bacterium]
MTENIKSVLFKEALGSRYLSYALSTIMARSLPDVRDGLKPVHRRLIFAMRELKLDPGSSPKKCARIVGDVVGKYHPHGDVAVYHTLVRLAQDFSLRYPLIEGQGNFGNIDGDNAAAMRYTEARLTDVAEALLEDIGQDTVDFRKNYDGEFEEPIVLPGKFPNLLANGSEGIAVGMATSIPPHNVEEICQALTHLIEKPEASVADLLQFVKGPDLPTGGTIVESPETLRLAYETGRGSFRVRAAYEIESLHNGVYQIVITEIPYQIQKSRLIEKLADIVITKKNMMLADVQDESAEDIRIVLTPKSRSVDPKMLMESLYKMTDLESRISLNMNVLDKNNVPMVMNLKEVMQSFLAHRLIVLDRRSRYRAQEIRKRLEILEGYLIAYLNLDEVIHLIREEDNPKPLMMTKWNLTDMQAESILNMRLRSLRRLEEIELRKEHDLLSKELKGLEELLSKKEAQWAFIKGEVESIRKQFGFAHKLGKRRTRFDQVETDLASIAVEAMIEKEPLTINLSEKGWIRALKGHTQGADLKYKEGDGPHLTLLAETTDKILLFADSGRVYTIPAHQLPGGRGFGEPLRLFIDLEQDQSILAMMVYDSQAESKILMASTDGRGFIVKASDVVAQTKNGKQIMVVPDPVRVQSVWPVQGTHAALVGENRRLLIFTLEEIPEMQKGRGVILQKYVGGGLMDLKLFNKDKGLSWMRKTQNFTLADMTPWLGRRAGVGRMVPEGFPRSGKFSG